MAWPLRSAQRQGRRIEATEAYVVSPLRKPGFENAVDGRLSTDRKVKNIESFSE